MKKCSLWWIIFAKLRVLYWIILGALILAYQFLKICEHTGISRHLVGINRIFFFNFLRYCTNMDTLSSFKLCHVVWLLILTYGKCLPSKYLPFWSNLGSQIPAYMWSLISTSISTFFAGVTELDSASWALRLSAVAGFKAGHDGGCADVFFSATVQDLISYSTSGFVLVLPSFQRIYPWGYKLLMICSRF